MSNMQQIPTGPVIGELHDDPTGIVLKTKKHIFGLIVLYVQALVGLGAAVGLIVFLLPELVGPDQNINNFISLALVFLLFLIVVVLLVATRVYLASQLVVTTKNLTQVNQVGLFNRKISQLSLQDVEDVSAEQKGVFATLFNFGTLFVETAGEQANFHFDYC